MPKKISILLADDHLMCREGLSYLLSNDYRFKVVGETSNYEETIKAARKHKPDIMLLDYDIAGLASYTIISSILKDSPKTKILVIGKIIKFDEVRKVIQEGAKGVISKKLEFAQLVEAIESVHNGNGYLSEEYVGAVINDIAKGNDQAAVRYKERLTQREKEMFSFLVSGLKGSEIAARLDISYKTVHKHRMNIMKKLEVTNVVQLVRLAYELGVVEVSS